MKAMWNWLFFQFVSLVFAFPAFATDPAVWWLFALNEEIFVRTRLCGGLGRTRTSNQALMSRQF
jgi:hypothetical protein